MQVLISDPNAVCRLIEDRRNRGIDQRDEVWDGVYVVLPNPDDEHQDVVGGLCVAMSQTVHEPGLGKARPGVNISDRVDDWEFNYRVPDFVVFLNETSAVCHGSFWYGGPEFAIEIVSPNDCSREKLSFYASVGTRELLLIERDPWRLELYRLKNGELKLHGESSLEEPQPIGSDVLPLTWRLTPGEARPRIEVTHGDGRQWVV
jgi:Uma2 family endonuclease